MTLRLFNFRMLCAVQWGLEMILRHMASSSLKNTTPFGVICHMDPFPNNLYQFLSNFTNVLILWARGRERGWACFDMAGLWITNGPGSGKVHLVIPQDVESTGRGDVQMQPVALMRTQDHQTGCFSQSYMLGLSMIWSHGQTMLATNAIRPSHNTHSAQAGQAALSLCSVASA